MPLSRDLIESCGFDYILSLLEVQSPLGRKYIKNLSFMVQQDEIATEIHKTKAFIRFASQNRSMQEEFSKIIGHVKDISQTCHKLELKETLDDVQLFEIKIFSMLCSRLEEYIPEYMDFLNLKNLKEVFALLDPVNLCMPSFYIYDEYSEELTQVRKRKQQIATAFPVDEQELINTAALENSLENAVRKELSQKLSDYASAMIHNLSMLAYADFSTAKALFILNFKLCCPEVSEHGICFEQLFNIELDSILSKNQKKFQPVDIALDRPVTVITGANMSGKTVVLKSLALNQLMFQTGFFLCAKTARITPVESIFLITKDSQSMDEGLSSYAFEILKVSDCIKHSQNGEKCLILIDELARTTNPQEGRAIVRSVMSILAEHDVYAVITTHYDGVLSKNAKHYRVSGIRKDKIGNSKIKRENITDYIDYSLISEDGWACVPKEALTIARLLDVDNELITRAEMFLTEGQKGGCADGK